MRFEKVVDLIEQVEAESGRLAMIDLLKSLFKSMTPEELNKAVYLLQGRIRPEYEGIELGIADKLVERALSQLSGLPLETIENMYADKGDLGLVAEEVVKRKKQKTLFSRTLTVEEVYNTLYKMATLAGKGSIKYKLDLLLNLLSNASPKEARYLVRMVTGKLRLGVGDMSILDALSEAFLGGKSYRPVLERAYNLHPDIGYIAQLAVKEGLEGVKKVGITLGIPIRMALAERLKDPEEILEKMGGRCAAEYKYDGERIQAHKDDGKIKLFSRRLEDITYQYPDVVESLKKHLKPERAIVEMECVAVDPVSGELRPFQELMQRRRKYSIEEMMKKIPVAVKLFDVLYVGGEDYTLKPYPQRRRKLEEIIIPSEEVDLARKIDVSDVETLEKFFEEAVSEGMEGIMAKSVDEDSIYEAGARSYRWVKLKREYKSELTDTVDLVIVGAFAGRGKRAETYGALLLAAYDPENDVFKTVCKCGTGFTDEDLQKLPQMLKPYTLKERHPKVISKIDADYWFEPAIVIECIGAEITLSPIHTCAIDEVKKGSGLAIRFPRFTGRYREDKSPREATTEDEILEMYRQKMIKIEG
ncbi:ATP-dependent DNA ligase [Candidatus Bathyarchaeota archaeon ex4484_205]|nr:MAG: ATP-dependent DNA ligase [Candidatus Bathyarchaeota archaeon ex4484_205]